MKRFKDFYLLTFSKKWVSRLMWIAVIDLQLSYILAFLDKMQIAETLSITVVTEIIGVMLGYFTKAFFETREEEKVKLEREREGLLPSDFEDFNEEDAQG